MGKRKFTQNMRGTTKRRRRPEYRIERRKDNFMGNKAGANRLGVRSDSGEPRAAGGPHEAPWYRSVKNHDWITLLSAAILVLISLSWWVDHIKFDDQIETKNTEITNLKEFAQQGARFTACDGQKLCVLAGVEKAECEAALPKCGDEHRELTER